MQRVPAVLEEALPAPSDDDAVAQGGRPQHHLLPVRLKQIGKLRDCGGFSAAVRTNQAQALAVVPNAIGARLGFAPTPADAEAIAERLNYLGGIPTTKPDPIKVGASLKEMIKQDQKDEESAIDLYRKIIIVARKEEDEVTHRLFRQILADEEEHHDVFSTLLEEI